MTEGQSLGLFGRRRVRLIRQTQVAECGLACLGMVADFHGLRLDMGTLRRRFPPSSRGLTLRALMTIADALGLTPRPLRVEFEALGELALPAILHWDLNHFVVLEAVSNRKALIHNPGGRSGWMRLAEVSDHFTGVALELEPSVDFEPGEARQRVRLRQLWTRIRGLKRAVTQTVLLSLMLQAFALVSPYYLQLAVDTAVPELNLGFLSVLAIGFGLFAVLTGVVTLLRATVLLSAGASFGYGLSSAVARKLFRLPVDWFGTRHVGDILSRFQSILPIRQMLAENAPAVFVDGLLALLTFTLMMVYSPTLSLVSALALLLYAAVRWVLFGMQRAAQDDMLVSGGREQSILIESLHGIRSLRLSAKETLRHALWQARMTDSVNASVRLQKFANIQTALQTTLFALENVAVVWLALSLVIKGGFSIGMVFAYLAYKTQFLLAGASLVDKASAYGMIGLHLERVADIALSDDDVSFKMPAGAEVELRGRIELRDVYYRYGPEDPFVLSGIDLAIADGESVAITGPSGGGKSTLLQIMVGLVEPTRGEVLVDGAALPLFGFKNYHRQIAAVLQEDTLFAGSIAENIAMFDEDADMARVREAAKAAAISGDIDAMAMGYETLVGDMGSALSGGQRQRILIARALYRRPRILFMDEGTSHLDEALEKEVNRAIRGLGITRVIVAHRRETIASADRVLALNAGKLSPQASQQG